MPERGALGGLVALVLGSFAVVMSATTINVAIAPMMVEYSISHSLAQGFSSVFLGMTVVFQMFAAVHIGLVVYALI